MDLFDDPNLTFSKLSAAWLLGLDPRMKIGGFTKMLCSAMERVNGKFDAEELRPLLRRHRIIPDAYLIDEEHKVAYLFEIEDTNPLTADKLRKLSEIWFRMDCIEWDMRVFLIDRYLSAWRSLQLADVWHALEFPMPKLAAKSNGPAIDWEATHEEATKIAINRPIFRRKSAA
jgi:hypothetical protein